MRFPARITYLFVLLLFLTPPLPLQAQDSSPGWLGVRIQALNPDLAEGFGLESDRGVLVSTVAPGSPAESGGIEPGDVILELGGKSVRNGEQFVREVRKLAPGRKVPFSIHRGGKIVTRMIEIGARPGGTPERESPPPPPIHPSFNPRNLIPPSSTYLGVQIQNLDEANLASYFSVDVNGGVLVTGVEPDSPAAESGIEGGDVILQIEDRPVSTVADLRKELSLMEPGDEVAIEILRRGKEKTIEVTLGGNRPNSLLRRFGGGGQRGGAHVQVMPFKIDEQLDKLREEIRELREEVRKLKEQI